MATPSTRNLVLLLSSGHTVRIALRKDDLNGNGGPTPQELNSFLEDLPALVGGRMEALVFSYIEDPSLPTYAIGKPLAPNDLQRISVEGPGTVVQYG